MSEVSGPAKEAGEEVEWIMRAAALSALLVLFEAFVAVLIVDAAGFRLRKGVVGFGDLDEFFGGRFIATAEMKGVRLLAIYVECGLLNGDSRFGALEHGVGMSLRILIGVVFLAKEAIGFLDLPICG